MIALSTDTDAPSVALTITTSDYHTAGEPFRIVHGDAPVPQGATVAERRVAAQHNAADADRIRQFLCQEPRGHADMYGGFIVPANDSGAHFGVLFWHKDGFSTACGHGTIALGVWATDTGLVASDPNGVTEVRIDVPSGRVAAFVERRNGTLVRATFRNVPSHVIERGIPVATSRGDVRADLSFSGAIYASVRAADLGLSVSPAHYTELIAAGREIKAALTHTAAAQHATDSRLSGVYGTILWEDLGTGHTPADPVRSRQRNVTVFADGEVDRSPCGSGTGARVALLAADGTLPHGATLEHRSIVDTVFHARWEPATTTISPSSSSSSSSSPIIPEVTGTAFHTGEHQFVLDPNDPVGLGFVLR
ncbi:proline racemase [Leucobacter luti]|uniref:proline racemase family protein n=1 Tax=Leucobacter luti TaxID=340320 RepID=UPI00104A9386|nr:proline racemase family protein [Leucobacter luti]MCW2287196.1 proline racemase [Leucobacter luti]TCK41422.1 proline racemase [Leucobacter luti]